MNVRATPATLMVVALLSGCELYDATLLRVLPGPASNLDPRCGNGALDEGEGCDPEIAEGEEGACPTACPNEDPCYPQVPAGADCHVECVGLRIERALSGDKCCPKGVGAGEDSDCGGCGDGIVGPAETCEPPSTCLTQDSCTSLSTCLIAVFSGSPETCSSRCRLEPVTACKDNDGCCPSSCDASSDSDCSASCNNGLVEPEAGESCEPTSETQPCPESCDDGVACTTDVKTGSANNCNVYCSSIGITAPAEGDGCCPEGATAVVDSDCLPRCGNSVRETPETCDPCPTSCDDADPCTDDGMSGEAALCSVECTHTPITAFTAGDGCCPSGANATTDADCNAQCGNAVREGGETCDPCPSDCNDGIACTTDQAAGSSDNCTLSCTHTAIMQAVGGDGCCPGGANANNDSDCSPLCGNGVVESGEQCDGGGRCRDCVQIFSSALAHRYPFDGTGTTVTDTIGGKNGTVMGASLSGSGTVSLTGGSSGPYVDLPNGLISSRTNVSIEIWLTWRGGNDWQRAFDFGNNSNGEGQQGGSATSEWFVSPCSSTGHVFMVLNFTSTANDTGSDKIAENGACLGQNTKRQLVGVFDDDNDTMRLYIDGALADTTTGVTGHLSSISDKNVWIGRSNYANDELNAVVHEFRIYSKALTTAEVQASYQAGDNP